MIPQTTPMYAIDDETKETYFIVGWEKGQGCLIPYGINLRLTHERPVAELLVASPGQWRFEC